MLFGFAILLLYLLIRPPLFNILSFLDTIEWLPLSRFCQYSSVIRTMPCLVSFLRFEASFLRSPGGFGALLQSFLCAWFFELVRLIGPMLLFSLTEAVPYVRSTWWQSSTLICKSSVRLPAVQGYNNGISLLTNVYVHTVVTQWTPIKPMPTLGLERFSYPWTIFKNVKNLLSDLPDLGLGAGIPQFVVPNLLVVGFARIFRAGWLF